MNEEDPKPFDFASLDSVMMLMIFGASNLIDKNQTTEAQAETIAKFYSRFLLIRSRHEESHVTKTDKACPFCSAASLSLLLNRSPI